MSQWTRADVDTIMHRMQQRADKAAKPSKYKNVKAEVNGEKFDSKREAAYWMGLKAREAAGEIVALCRQLPFDLRCPTTGSPSGATVVVARYFCDFWYLENGTPHIVDAKGKRTALYQLKKKWLELQDGIIIEEV